MAYSNIFDPSKFAIVVVGSRTRIFRRNALQEPPMSIPDFLAAQRDLRSLAKRWIEDSPASDTYYGLSMDPSTLEDRLPDGSFNLWRGFAVEPSDSGSWAIFRQHLLEHICSGREQLFEYVLSWCAHMIQQPEVKPGVALLLYGAAHGTGKDTVGEVLAKLLYRINYCRIQSSQHLTDAFNGTTLLNTLLLHGEEIWVRQNTPAVGVLKGLISSPLVDVRFMRTDPFNATSSMRVLLTSNEPNPVRVEPGDRRFQAIMVPKHKHTQDIPYFESMRAELDAGGYGRLMHDLLRRPLADHCIRQLVRTPEHDELKTLSMTPVAQYVASLVSRQPQERVDQTPTKLHASYLRAFPRDPVSLIHFGRELKQLGVEQKRSAKGRSYQLVDPEPIRDILRDRYPGIEEHYDFGPSGSVEDRGAQELEDRGAQEPES